MGKIYVGQPFKIECETFVDLTNATAQKVKFAAPDESTGSWDATIVDAKGGIIEYDVPQGETTLFGDYSFWSYVTIGGGDYPGEAEVVEIHKEGT